MSIARSPEARLDQLSQWFAHQSGMMRKNHNHEYQEFVQLINQMTELAKKLDEMHGFTQA